MTGALNIVGNKRLWPFWVVLAVTLVLLPRLGSYGFWEPAEMDIASKALPLSTQEKAEEEEQEKRKREKREQSWTALEKRSGVEAADKARAQHTKTDALRQEKLARQNYQAPLRDAMVKQGIETFGVREWGARFPFFLLALLAALTTYFLGVRIRGPNAGAMATLVLLASPLFIFQARQLNGELGALTGGAMMLLAAIGLCSPAKTRAIGLYVVDALLLLLGASLSYYSAGFLVGFLTPLGAISLALIVSALEDREGEPSKRLPIAAALALLLFLAAFFYFIGEVFEFADAKDDEFSIFGKVLHAEPGFSKLLGGTWKQEGNLKINFNSLFEQIAFGLFPWVCLAPIAVARMGMGTNRQSNAIGARMLFTWAAAAWLVSSLALRKIGPVQYAAVPAVAVAIGVWLDELMSARKERLSQGETTERNMLTPPLIALFAAFAAIVISKDIKSFPTKLLSLHLDTAIAKFPSGISMHKFIMAQGIAFALLLGAGLYFTQVSSDGSKLRRTTAMLGRWGIPAALGVSFLMSLFLAQVWTPRLSTKLSSRATYGVYHQLREEGNTLGIVGKASSGSKFYARGDFQALRGRSDLVTFLQRPERVFASVKASELCPIHKESNKQGFDYYVVDDSNAERILLSNRMWNAAVAVPAGLEAVMRDYLDQNPLWRYIVRDKPKTIQHELDINYDNKLQLIGVDLPDNINRGDDFEVTLYYHVLKPISRNWQIFMHFDGAGVRFQGDHFPVKKRCGTNYWQAGDYIVDQFTVESSNMGIANKDYKIWAGLFVGSSGNWENMKVVSPEPDDNNRVQVGTIHMN